jgi:cephalosporin hydroxylase
VTGIRHALSYPRRYAAATAVVRRIRRLPELDLPSALEFAQNLSWYGDKLRPTQSPEEILWLLEQLVALRPATIVEVGTDSGGTLFLWSRVAAQDAWLVAVDMRPLGLLGSWSAYGLVRRGLARRLQRIELVMPADSHDPATVDRVRGILGDRSVDFLFIDGDHTYEGVKRDYELWSPLVRSGGIVAFHDIGPDQPDGFGTASFWSELKLCEATEEHIATAEPRYGIGVVYVR